METLKIFFLVLAVAYLFAKFADSGAGGRSRYRPFRMSRYRRRRW
ncbi:hypothetical protein [Leptolyngbya sp. Heron Island J]|nr:hypothetical protein [Leptolyngbya sp. Heron Island J]